MKDGLYFLHPDGCCWIGAIIRDGRLVATIEECNAATHAAANDSLAGLVPSEDDIVLDGCTEIIREVLGEDTVPAMVVVARRAGGE